MRTSILQKVDVTSGGGEDGKKKWTRYTAVLADGTKASSFDAKLGRWLQDNTGSLIDYDAEQEGKFTNLTGALLHQGDAPLGADAQRPRHPNDSRLIVRQVALKCAVDLTASGQIPIEQLRKYADKFVEWVYEDQGEQHIKEDGTT